SFRHGTRGGRATIQPHMRPPARRWLREQERFMLLLITPAAAILLLFQVVPIVIGANASFRDWTLYDPQKTWVGLAHYGAVLIGRTEVWLWTPCFTLLLLAGLHPLPREPFEAAAIDGAGRWNTFRFVTVPLLRSIIVVCAVIRAIDAFRTFDIVWTLTGGGPGRSTELFSLYAYVYAFLNLDFGRGSAAAMIGAAIVLVVGLGLFRALDRLVEVSR